MILKDRGHDPIHLGPITLKTAVDAKFSNNR